MSRTGTSGFQYLVWHRARFGGLTPLQVGDVVRVGRRSSPLSGHLGKVIDIAFGDPYGPLLVRFDNGLRFRYQRHELVALTSSFDSADNDR